MLNHKILILTSIFSLLITSFSAHAETITHTVKKGESLSVIAKRYLKDGSRWQEILNANKHIKNKNSLKVGDKIRIKLDNKSLKLAATSTYSDTPRLKPKHSGMQLAIEEVHNSRIQHFVSEHKVIDSDTLMLTPSVEAIKLKQDGEYIYASKVRSYYIPSGIYGIYERQHKYRNGHLELKKVGEAKLISKDDDLGKFVILTKTKAKLNSPYLLPLPAPHKKLRALEAQSDIRAKISYVFDPNLPSHFVSIDKGLKHNIYPGQIVNFHKNDPIDGRTRQINFLEGSSGKLLIFKTFDQFSYAVAISSTQAPAIGDIVR